MSFVTVKNFSKHYGGTYVFDRIDFTLQKGEFVTLLGPSGCGKSTLLRCIAGLSMPDTGKLEVDGEDITSLAPQKRNIGMVFQSYALFPNMTVEDNIAFGLKMAGCPVDDISRRVADSIRLVELAGKERNKPHELSGGQRQRVALARALVVEPRILLLDEPLSALDARIRKNLREQIRDIQQRLNLTTLFVTHDQEEALQLSDRVFVMDKGRIVQAGTAEDVYTRPANLLVAGFMGNYNILSQEAAVKLFGHQDSGRLAIRPEAIGLSVAKPEENKLAGQIMQHQLLGSIIRYEVEIGTERLFVDCLNRRSSDLLPTGTQVCLQIDPSDWAVVN